MTAAGVRHTLQALRLKSLSDIPDDIPTVTWDWVVSGYGRARKRKFSEDSESADEKDSLDFEFMHAAFSERIDAGCSWKNTRQGKQCGEAAHDPALRADSTDDHSGDMSHISYVLACEEASHAYFDYSTFSQENRPAQTGQHGVSHTLLPPPPLVFKFVDGHKADGLAPSEEGENASEHGDPLSEYYAQARADREVQVSKTIGDLNTLTTYSPRCSGIEMHQIQMMRTTISTFIANQHRGG